MFGYIAVQPQALTEEAKTRYRSRYCGLCRALRDRAGAAGRLALSNDMTFLSILLSSLYEPKESAGSDPCPLHPLKKTAWTRSACTDYAADMNLFLAYLKCLDNVADEGSRAAALRAKRLEKPAALAEERWKEQARGVREALEEIGRLEKENSADVDRLCRLSGQMLGSVFAYRDDVFAPVLYAAGGALGAFVYLMDAWEDYDGDVRKGCFNPLREMHAQADYEDLIHDVLLMKMGEASEALKLLPLQKDMDLIENVVYHGVWQRYDMKMKQKAGGAGDGEDEAGGCADPDGTKESDR